MTTTIDDLQAITEIDDNSLTPIDNGSQTFKAKMSTLKPYFNAPMQTQIAAIAERVKDLGVKSWDLFAPTIYSYYGIAYSPSLGLFAASSAGANHLATSPDGHTWTTRTSPANTWRGIAWSSSLGMFVGVSSDGSWNRVMSSTNGTTWTAGTSPADNQWLDVCWSPEVGKFVAVAASGTNNRVMNSTTGTFWQTRDADGEHYWRKVIWVSELELFIAVGQNASTGQGCITTSPDGDNWTLQRDDIAVNLGAVCWSNDLQKLVAFNTGSSTSFFAVTSTDGITWSNVKTSSIGATRAFGGAAWNSQLKLFIAVGNYDSILVSPSGEGNDWRSFLDVNFDHGNVSNVFYEPTLKVLLATSADVSTNRIVTMNNLFAGDFPLL